MTDTLTPTLRSEAILSTIPDIQGPTESEPGPDNKQQTGDLNVTSFSTDLSHVRVGSRIFSKSGCGKYLEIVSLHTLLEGSTALFGDIASRGSYLVLTSRRKKPTRTENRGRPIRQISQPLGLGGEGDSSQKLGHEGSRCQHCSREPSTSNRGSESPLAPEISGNEQESSDESLSPSELDESEELDSAEESWSEGSTEATDGEAALWNNMESSEDESTCQTQSEDGSGASEDETASNAPAHSYGQLKEESDSDGGHFDFDYGSDDDAYEGDSDYSEPPDAINDDYYDSDEDEPPRRFYPSRRPKPEADAQMGSIYIYDLGPENPVQLFKLSRPLPIMLYKSPPVVHPTEPLVVWPLCGGEILFVDFKGKTYFIRKARPTTKKSKAPSMSETEIY